MTNRFFVDLSAVPANIDKIAVTVTIYDADKRRQNFGQVSNSYCRIVNDETGEELFATTSARIIPSKPQWS